LREQSQHVEIVALQPDGAEHTFEGWKHMATTGRIPPIYDAEVPHRMVPVSNAEADEMLKLVARQEGLLLSPSTAGNLAGAIKVAEQLNEGVVVTTFADDFSKYSADYARIFEQ
jgi:cysteine synthase B